MEEIRREAITVMCPLLSLRTPLPLDLRKLQLDSSKAIKLSTDKNKRMRFFPHSLLFLCLFIPLSPLCSSLCPLPYPPLGLRALPNLSLPLAFSPSLSGHDYPPHPPLPIQMLLCVWLCITFYWIAVFRAFIREALPFLFSLQYSVIMLSATRAHTCVCMCVLVCDARMLVIDWRS